MTSSSGRNAADKVAVLAALKRDLARLDAEGRPRRNRAVVATGATAVDAHLPDGGLQWATVHEIAGIGASSFTAAVLGRFAAARSGTLVWCQHRRRVADEGQIYGPGLAAFGIDTARLLLVDVRDDSEALWAMEEALRSNAVTAVVGEVGQVDLFQSRRLQLAAETGGGAGFLLRPTAPRLVASAAVTRWCVQARTQPSLWPELGALAWRAELWRCKGAAPAEWEVLFDEPTLRFAMAAPLADRTLAPRTAASGR